MTGQERFRLLKKEINKARKENGQEGEVAFKIDPADLLGYSFAKEKDGVFQKATVKEIHKLMDDTYLSVEYLSGQTILMEYNELINILNAAEEDGDGLWTFKSIDGHRKQGRSWEVLVNWDHCERSWEPLSEMRLADSITLAKYAIDNDLLDENGWKWARIKEKNPKKFQRLARIFKSQVKEKKSRFKFGIQVPRGVKEAMKL